ncbi:MAG TPA: hypothetical protein VFF40_07250 [Acidimicrobiia bacterium]|nr:hypothetical protein [Acidimicrobiia bacterium]
MRKFLAALSAALSLTIVSVATPASAAKPGSATTIQSGELLNSAGEVITVGFDAWGYNYQGHMFNGKYCDAYRDASWCQPYKDINLSMKWNDAWLANTDVTDDSDVLLDRHLGFATYIGSGAWVTNHMSGVNDDGTVWTSFVKIVAAPADANLNAGVWYTAGGVELGSEIWGEFFIAQEVTNDPSTGEHGAQYISPFGPGFGHI